MDENGVVTVKTAGFGGPGESGEELEVTSRALIREDGGILRIEYDESRLTGMEGVRTALSLEGDCLTLSRTGRVTYDMLFQNGRRLLSPYDTGFGLLQMSVTTHSLEHRRRGGAGRITAEYTLEINNAAVGRGRVSILYRLDAPASS